MRLPTEGWPGSVGLGGWLRSETVYLPEDSYQSQAQCSVDQNQRVTATLNRHVFFDDYPLVSIELALVFFDDKGQFDADHHAGRLSAQRCVVNYSSFAQSVSARRFNSICGSLD